MKKILAHVLLTFVISVPLFNASKFTFAQPQLQQNTWVWPLTGGTALENSKYGTVVENTDYAVKNLDLVHGRPTHLTCFDVGWHRIYHAGVDLYLPDGQTANQPVKAVSSGLVVHNSGFENNNTIIISHTQANVYSVYWHLSEALIPSGSSVQAGQVIGKVTSNIYTGRFPDVHPFGNDDSHLHFEIRRFLDPSNLFPPDYSGCNVTYPPGVGYTYPNQPDAYNYLDPMAFLQARVSPPSLAYRRYLPLVSELNASVPNCIEGQSRFNPIPVLKEALRTLPPG